MDYRFGDGRDWFFEKRFGMFVHWGIYAIPAWHEQLQWRGKMSRSEYVKYAEQFNPDKFDPEQWLDIAQAAGMEYMTFTTKHHDGFCMWNTKLTDFNVMNSPYGKDILAELADACHKRNFPLCLYYSVVDWHQPNYPNQGRSHEIPGPEEGDRPDWDAYMEFLKAQIRELCTNYGEIHGIWWDMNVPEYKDPSVNQMIRELQSKAVVNQRGFDEGDFGTPERDWNKENDGKITVFDKPTEACNSVGSQSWGYREDEDYYSSRYLIGSMGEYMAKGANYLLNVGPMADGAFPQQALNSLSQIGRWYKRVKKAFSDATPVAGMVDNDNVLTTRDGNTLYLHIYNELNSSGLSLKPIDRLPKSAVLLNTGEKVEAAVDVLPSLHEEGEPFLRLRNLPVESTPDGNFVIRLDFDDLP